MGFVLYPLSMVYHIYWFLYVECFFHSRNKSHLVMMHDIANVYWVLFALILLRILLSVFIRDINLSFSFLVLLPLVSEWCWLHKIILEVIRLLVISFSPLHFFGLLWERLALTLLNVCCLHCYRNVVQASTLMEKYVILLFIIGLSSFSISSQFKSW